jgi:hypothetical protein
MQDTTVLEEIAQAAARLIVEEGLDYGAAKKRAVRDLALPARTALPDHDAVEDAVREYIDIFCSDTQPGELLALRELALTWMERVAEFSPHLAGSVWHGTATRLSDIYIGLFCEDAKAAELSLINHDVRYEPREVTGFKGEPVQALSIHSLCKPFNETVGVHLLIYEANDIRGALKPDSKGRKPRGAIQDLRALLKRESI